jgi:hypothetical protein
MTEYTFGPVLDPIILAVMAVCTLALLGQIICEAGFPLDRSRERK